MSDAMDHVKKIAEDMKDEADKTDDAANSEDVEVESHTEHSETNIEKSGDDAKGAVSS